MKMFKFEIQEHWFGGTTLMVYEVKARTSKSADKKIHQIMGNRSWDWTLVATRKSDASDTEDYRCLALVLPSQQKGG